MLLSLHRLELIAQVCSPGSATPPVAFLIHLLNIHDNGRLCLQQH
jgi:hypothetical protein